MTTREKLRQLIDIELVGRIDGCNAAMDELETVEGKAECRGRIKAYFTIIEAIENMLAEEDII